MRYVRTEDGRIVEEYNLEPGFKQTIITIKSKRDNKELTKIVCDDLDTSLEMIVICQYCEHHKIKLKDIKYETTTLFNKILKQADAIEELCDEVVCENKVKSLVNIYTDETKAEMIMTTCKELLYKGKKDIYGAIWTDKGLKYVAKMNEKGELELL